MENQAHDEIFLGTRGLICDHLEGGLELVLFIIILQQSGNFIGKYHILSQKLWLDIQTSGS